MFGSARQIGQREDADDASLVFDRTPGVADNPDLSRLAAEAALVSEEDDKACRIAGALTTGRDAPYWLRLRAFCQARAGKPDQAQLTAEQVWRTGRLPVAPRPPARLRRLGGTALTVILLIAAAQLLQRRKHG